MPSFLRFLADNFRWLAGGFLLTLFSSFGQTYFISLSSGEIRRAFDLSNGGFGALYMLATLGSALTLPVLGRVMDRYPAAIVAAGTMLMLAVATILMGFAGGAVMLVLALYLLRLFGQGMMTQTALTSTGRWFAANRGRAVSLVTLGQQVGEGIFPFLFVVAAGALGWRGGWFACAALLLVLALPLGVMLLKVERNPAGDVVPTRQRAGRDWTRAEVLRDPNFYVLCSGVLAPPFVATTIFFHQVYLTELRGWPLGIFAGAFVVMSATTVVTTLTAGWLIDRFTAIRLLPTFLLPLGLACFAIAWLDQAWTIPLFMMLLGISFGFSSTLIGALWPEIYGTRELGSIRSVVVAMMVFATALGPGLTGWLIDIGVSYPLQLAAMGVYAFAAAGAMVLVSRRYRDRRMIEAMELPG
ncbi:MFS transporter [Consotaella aegiceratis]|uniref:MFS transporter n=1 Tax=Consotaella aegiceratis TaxID=3097961 RepID=UPI002F416E15